MKSRKITPDFKVVVDSVHKETVLSIQSLGEFQYFAFFVYTAYRVGALFKGYFPEGTVLKLLECCYYFIVALDL